MKVKDIQKSQEVAKAMWEAAQSWLWLILMWLSISVNFTHIQDILAKWAGKSDWTTWGGAVIVEVISGLTFSNALANLGVMLASIGKNATKEKKRRARLYFGLSSSFGLSSVVFSGWVNILWYNGNALAGIVTPIATVVCAIMEASRRYEIQIQQVKQVEEETIKRGTCKVCGLEIERKMLIKGRCPDCQRAAEGKTHALPLALSLEVLERDGWQCYYCGTNLKEVPAGERHIDHFNPKANGGTDDIDNLVTACAHCNLSKRDFPPNEREQQRFSLYLRAKAAGPDKRTQILELASTNGDKRPLKQKEIAEILHTSPGWVSTIIKEAEQSQNEED